jgi:uncharacterized protein YndB with AHSA1/START domain
MDMIEQTMERDLGTVDEAADGTVTLRYERVFPRPIATVWSAITEPARIADWLGPAELEPRVGGRFAVRVGPGGRVPIEGKVVVWEPPSVLACTWNWPEGPAGTIRYELSPDGAHATRLVFTHVGLSAERQNSVLAGWHLYLERLEQAVRGERPPADFSARHAEVQALYGDVEACAPTD